MAMCMYTSLVERTPGAGRHANFSCGVASASEINCCDTCVHSPSYPSRMPSGNLFCAHNGALISNNTRHAFAPIVFIATLLIPPLAALPRHRAAAKYKSLPRASCEVTTLKVSLRGQPWGTIWPPTPLAVEAGGKL